MFSIFILGIHAIMIMAIEELKELAIDMMQPFLLDPGYEYPQDSMTGMSDIIQGTMRVLEEMNREILRLGAGKESFACAQNALSRVHYYQTLAWNPIGGFLDTIQDSIKFYRKSGHAGIAYVLQMGLLKEQAFVFDDEVENFIICRREFFEELSLTSSTNGSKFLNTSSNYHVYITTEKTCTKSNHREAYPGWISSRLPGTVSSPCTL